DALSLLGVLLQEPDFFAFHVLPAKNLLVGLISKARSALHHDWATAVPADIHPLLQAWVCHLREHPPEPIPRRLHTTAPLHLYVDASTTMIAYEAHQFDRPVLRGQLPLTKSQRHLHINALELLGIYYALARVRLLELDTRMKFHDLRVYCDSLTAVAIARDRRIPAGLHEALTRKYLELIIAVSGNRSVTYTHIKGTANPADAGTRSTLLDDILRVRDKYDTIARENKTNRSAGPADVLNPPPGTTPAPTLAACPVRKRDETFDNDSIARRVRLRREAPCASTSSSSSAASADLPPGVMCRSSSSTSLSDGTSPASPPPRVPAKTTDDIPSTRLLDYAFARLPDDILDRLTALPLTDGLKHSIALDVHGPYFNHLYVLTCTCRLTTHLLCVPLSTAPLSTDVIDLLNYITCTFGIIPTVVRSDNGSIFRKVAPTLPFITWEFTPPYSSASNGQHERRH
ncbi:hypothetical protein FOZ62_000362, partial [Perkinsus olseni]